MRGGREGGVGGVGGLLVDVGDRLEGGQSARRESRGVGGQPGDGTGGPEVDGADTVERDPVKGDVGLGGWGGIGERGTGGAEVFHVKQEVDLVASYLPIMEGALVDLEQGSDLAGEPHLFEDLAGEGLGGGLAELDMASGEVGVAAPAAAAEEDAGGAGAEVDGDAAGDELDVAGLILGVGLGHGRRIAEGGRWGVGGCFT